MITEIEQHIANLSIANKREKAIRAIYDISSSDEKNLIVQAGGIPVLSKLLNDENTDIKKYAAATLLAIFTNGVDARSFTQDTDIDTLFNLLDDTNFEVKKYAAGLLWKVLDCGTWYRYFDEKTELIEYSVLILMRMFNNTDTEARKNATGAFQAIVRMPFSTKRLFIELGVISPLLGLLSDIDNEVIENAWVALSVIIRSLLWEKEFFAELDFAEVIQHLVKLLYNQNIHAKESAIKLLSMSAGSSQSGSALILESNALPLLINLLTDQNFSIQEYASTTLMFITDNNIQHPLLQPIVRAIPFLVELFVSTNSANIAIRKYLCAILWYLSLNTEIKPSINEAISDEQWLSLLSDSSFWADDLSRSDYRYDIMLDRLAFPDYLSSALLDIKTDSTEKYGVDLHSPLFNLLNNANKRIQLQFSIGIEKAAQCILCKGAIFEVSGISCLMEFLENTDMAINILKALATVSENAKNKLPFIESGFAIKAIMLLGDSRQEIREYAAKAIKSLIAIAECKEQMIQTETILALLPLLQHENTETIENAVGILAHFAQNSLGQSKIVQTDALTVLQGLVEEGATEAIQGDAQTVINLCADFNKTLDATDAEKSDNEDHGEEYDNWLDKEINQNPNKTEEQLAKEREQFDQFTLTFHESNTIDLTVKNGDQQRIRDLESQISLLEERIILQEREIHQLQITATQNDNLSETEKERLRILIEKDRLEENRLKQQLLIISNPLYNTYYQAFKNDFSSLTIASFAVGQYIEPSNSLIAGTVATAMDAVGSFFPAVSVLGALIRSGDSYLREKFLIKLKTFFVTPNDAEILFENTARLLLDYSQEHLRTLTKEQAKKDIQKIIQAIASKNPPDRTAEALCSVVTEKKQASTQNTELLVTTSAKNRIQYDNELSRLKNDVTHLNNKIEKLEEERRQDALRIARLEEMVLNLISGKSTEILPLISSEATMQENSSSQLAEKREQFESLHVFFKEIFLSVTHANQRKPSEGGSIINIARINLSHFRDNKHRENKKLLQDMATHDASSQIHTLIQIFEQNRDTNDSISNQLVQSIYNQANAIPLLHEKIKHKNFVSASINITDLDRNNREKRLMLMDILRELHEQINRQQNSSTNRLAISV